MVRTRRPYIRRGAQGIALLLGLTLIFLVFAEAGLRLCPPGLLPKEIRQWRHTTPDVVGVHHPYIGHLEQPHRTGVFTGQDFKASYHTDGYGFRNPWPWPDRADIVVLGNSLTFGYGVEDDQAWPAVLAQSLWPHRVLNLGLMGASPQQYGRVYETFGTLLHPKVVVVGLFGVEALRAAALFDRWWQAGRGSNFRLWREFGNLHFHLAQPLDALQHLFRRYSYVYHVARTVTSMWEQPSSKAFWFVGGRRLHLVPRRLVEGIAMLRPDRRAFQLVLQALEGIQTSAQAHGAQALFVFQPSKEEIYLPLLGEKAPDLSRVLRQTLVQRGLVCLDLAPLLQQWAAKGEQLFLAADRHPNARGYALIAQRVLRHLADHAQTYGLRALSRAHGRQGSQVEAQLSH